MREAAVAPEVSVTDTKVEADDVCVRQHRANSTKHPNALWNSRLVEGRSDTESRNGVRDKRSHVPSFLFFLFLLDADGTVGGDFVDKVSGADHFWRGRILLEHIEDVGIFRDVAQDVGVNAGAGLLSFGGGSF